ncbi:MAG: nucleotidyltransferase domain-containing protein [Brevundimonas sp.]|uniref:nucleotidyltransferase domain-containing protein n=1 Tax=Brevundimonas sp. TaxID=1871086 RepID=UPI0025B93811|nr:nucleotidyltransferase domain-containing protein [Brevundimonas sp.]MBX3478024.1 nucleotidyltransferase domain-containing protein [Brevundimonas sp.]
MSFSSFSADMSPDAIVRVQAILDGVARDEGVHIPLAIESGSRAWGFPSPDSDYDGRFIYVRPAHQALTIWPRRDVIETPLVGEMDVNGWDLSKALRLLLKGNAVVVEWLQSPIAYRDTPWFRDALLGFADHWLDRGRVINHYLRLGQRQKMLHVDRGAEVSLKKTFYCLRPAAALLWLEQHPGRAIAPMHFPTLMAGIDASHDVQIRIADLIAQKAVTREMGVAPAPPELLAFIDDAFARAEAWISEPTAASPDAMRAGDALFVEVTRRLDATPS